MHITSSMQRPKFILFSSMSFTVISYAPRTGWSSNVCATSHNLNISVVQNVTGRSGLSLVFASHLCYGNALDVESKTIDFVTRDRNKCLWIHNFVYQQGLNNQENFVCLWKPNC